MAQFGFYAEDYPVGTKLRDLGFTATSALNNDCVVQLDAQGAKVWLTEDQENYPIYFTDLGGDHSSHEILLVSNSRWSNDGTGVAGSLGGSIRATQTQRGKFFFTTALAYKSGFNAPDLGSFTDVYAVRCQIVNQTVKIKGWKSSDNDVLTMAKDEPTAWYATYTESSLTGGAPGFSRGSAFFIGIGTDGDPAPSGPMPQAYVTTPVGLSATNITSDGVTLNWSAG